MMSDQERDRVPGRGKGPTEQEVRRATPAASGGREVRIGIFVLVGVFSVLLLLFVLTDPATFRGRYIVGTEVDDAGGVRRGDPVQMRGVNIGRVHRFEMIDDRVAISLEIEGQWEIPDDSRARVSGMGLLGGRTIEIVPGTSATPLQQAGIIPGESSGRVEDLADVLGEEVQDVFDRMQHLFSEPAVASVHASAGDLERLLATLTEMADEQRVEIQRLSASLRRSAEQLEGATSGEELGRAIARADSTMAEFNRAAETLGRATTSLESVLARLDRGEGTLGQLSTNDELFRNLNTAAEEIGLLARDVRENPGRYVRLRLF